MSPSEIRALRVSLGLTQEQFATLLGVHSLTTSKWERSVLTPSPYQVALMRSFEASCEQEPRIGEYVVAALLGAGVGAALYCLLRPAFESLPQRRSGRRRRSRKGRTR